MHYKKSPTFDKDLNNIFLVFLFVVINVVIMNSNISFLESIQPISKLIIESTIPFFVLMFMFIRSFIVEFNEKIFLDTEKDLVPIKTFRVGGQFANPEKKSSKPVHASGPFITLRFYNDFFVISCIYTVQFNYKDITKIKYKPDSTFFTTPIYIKDTNNNFWVSIWSKNKKEIYETLKELCPNPDLYNN